MNRVLDRLWIGSGEDVRPPVLRSLGFSGIVDLRDGVASYPSEVEVHRLGNRDGDPWQLAEVERVLDFIHAWVRRGRVLVACAAGISRSASIVAAYLVRCGWDEPTALEHLRAARPRIAPVPVMLEAALRGALDEEMAHRSLSEDPKPNTEHVMRVLDRLNEQARVGSDGGSAR